MGAPTLVTPRGSSRLSKVVRRVVRRADPTALDQRDERLALEDFLVAAFLEVAFVAPVLAAAFLEVAFLAPVLAAVFFGTTFFGARAPEAESTVSVPGAGITVVSLADDHRTRTIEPITAVTAPSRSEPLPDDRRIRSPTFSMNGHLSSRSPTNAEL
jgi:hypothetical protein